MSLDLPICKSCYRVHRLGTPCNPWEALGDQTSTYGSPPPAPMRTNSVSSAYTAQSTSYGIPPSTAPAGTSFTSDTLTIRNSGTTGHGRAPPMAPAGLGFIPAYQTSGGTDSTGYGYGMPPSTAPAGPAFVPAYQTRRGTDNTDDSRARAMALVGTGLVTIARTRRKRTGFNQGPARRGPGIGNRTNPMTNPVPSQSLEREEETEDGLKFIRVYPPHRSSAYKCPKCQKVFNSITNRNYPEYSLRTHTCKKEAAMKSTSVQTGGR